MFRKTNIKDKKANVLLTNDGVLIKIEEISFLYPLSEKRKQEIEAAIILTSDINMASLNGYGSFSIATTTSDLLRYIKMRNYKINALYNDNPEKKNSLNTEIKREDVQPSLPPKKKKNASGDVSSEKGDDAEQAIKYQKEKVQQQELCADFDQEYKEELADAEKRHQEKKLKRRREREREQEGFEH